MESYIKAARTDAKADFLAIGVATLTDNGTDPNSGQKICFGRVDLEVYSTVDNETIAAGSISEIQGGISSDDARAKTAKKLGDAMGQIISAKIQDYWTERQMYGSEYVVQIKGNFIPVERVVINKAMQNVNGIKNVVQRTSDSTLLEFTVNYSGQESIGDAVFLKLYESSLSSKFKNYDYKLDGNRLIFTPIK